MITYFDVEMYPVGEGGTDSGDPVVRRIGMSAEAWG
jgi:hypothetical protein